MPIAATQSAIRNPPSTIEGKLINDLADPNMTLGDVAYLHDLSLENLTLWIVRPDITERLKALTDSIYLRVRLAAITHLATTVNALNTMIGAYIDEERHAPVNPSSIQDREQRRRARETARKAVALLSRLAHLPAQRRKAATPSPLGEGRGGVAEIAHPGSHDHHTPPTPEPKGCRPVAQGTASRRAEPRVRAAPCPSPTGGPAPSLVNFTPRDLDDRAGQAPAATLSLFLSPLAALEGGSLPLEPVPRDVRISLEGNAESHRLLHPLDNEIAGYRRDGLRSLEDKFIVDLKEHENWVGRIT